MTAHSQLSRDAATVMVERPSGLHSGRRRGLAAAARGWVLAVFLLAPAAQALVDPSPTAGDSPPEPAGQVWIGLGGEPLPFTAPDQVEEYLRSAKLVSMDEIPVGVTRPQKVLLELDGLRVDAAFRTVDLFKRQERLANGTVINNFRDSYASEVAAYRLDRLLELGAVPPTVIRRLGGERGSLQLWIETAMTQRQRVVRGVQPPDRLHYQRQLRTMSVFDNLIHNIDRNQGNSLIDHTWKLWFIDHTRAFLRSKRLHDPGRVIWVERTLWKRLQDLDDEEIRTAMKGALDGPEIKALLERRRLLVDLIHHRIDTHGEREVLFEYGDPAPPMR